MLPLWVYLACQTETKEIEPTQKPVEEDVYEEEEEEEVIEENSVPVIREAGFGSISPRSKEKLEVKTSVIDQDGDRIRMDYEWSINGKNIPSERRAYLDPSWFKSGDKIQVRVVASDSKSETDTVIETMIQNTPPKWVQDPRSVTKLNGYRVEAVDPDGGPITYKLDGEPKGMRIDPKRGVLSYRGSTDAKAGTYNIKIIAEDEAGDSVQWSFSIAVSAGSGAEQKK
ncbi:MAG: cadherin repeat domain-containing protein [Myxococcota bacterium]|nr:cadherin repeat domain-containing protein [Myxococcota bacterium]